MNIKRSAIVEITIDTPEVWNSSIEQLIKDSPFKLVVEGVGVIKVKLSSDEDAETEHARYVKIIKNTKTIVPSFEKPVLVKVSQDTQLAGVTLCHMENLLEEAHIMEIYIDPKDKRKVYICSNRPKDDPGRNIWFEVIDNG